MLRLSDNEKHTPEFLTLVTGAANQLRDMAYKAQCDAEEAENIAKAVDNAMGNPQLTLEEEEAPAPSRNGNGVHAGNGKAKPKPKPKAAKKGKRTRLAKHPRLVDGKIVASN